MIGTLGGGLKTAGQDTAGEDRSQDSSEEKPLEKSGFP